MIDNEELLFQNFTENVTLKTLPEMERKLATQMMEATLLLSTVEDKEGTATALRAVNQEEASDIRLDRCIQLADKLWDAVTRPGAFASKGSQRVQWLNDFKKEVGDTIFAIYRTQLDEIGVKRDEIIIIGKI